MKKKITREQIVETALELLKDKRDIHSVNLREIARVLGCAHTNLYNYFSSYHELLWEAHIEIQRTFIKKMTRELAQMPDDRTKLRRFFFLLAELYLDHPGWFRLAWVDYIDDVRPQDDAAATEDTVRAMVALLKHIWLGMYPHAPKPECIHGVLHDVHCYIVGEVSNFINGRGLIADGELLKHHIADTAVRFFTLTLRGE